MKVASLGLLLLMAVGLLLAATAPAHAQYPDVSTVTPYTAEANYMSLPGYLRWQVYMERQTWISMREAYEIVLEQVGGS